MSPLTNITRYIPHIIQLKFSVNNTHHITTKIEPQNYIFPTQSPTSFSLWVKPKESPNSPKSHYDVANSMSHYDVANSKSATMWHYLQSPLLHGTSKACCYMAPLTKPVASWQYFTKSQNHFHKIQIIIWQLFS